MRSAFLRRSFCQIVAVTAGGQALLGCGDDDEGGPGDKPVSTDPEDVLRVFPQGLASGDPKPDTVILWTRVEPEAEGALTIRYEVAKDEDFAEMVAEGDLDVDESTDHTLRIKLTGLDAYTTYYYRFTAQSVRSIVGRTKTAPTKDQDVNVRFAFATCQDFNGRYYHAWKALVEDEDDVDFVLFLGDYVYETEGDPAFQNPTDDRHISLPDGLELGDEQKFNAALTLADYRALYKQYKSDADLQLAHARFPFICIWDDHEFANDCWQDHSTHFDEAQGDEKDSSRRHDATQAWFEYIPADVEFDASASFPNDIVTYRQLRFGKHVDIVLTDQRYYRDDHLINEADINFDVAKTSPNSALGSRLFVLKSGFDVLEAEAKPTMLGATQKQWLIDSLRDSDATWKIWGNQAPLGQMALDLSSFDQLPAQFQEAFYFSTDQWDGYRSERAEILTALSGTRNLVALSGDIHAFYACKVELDYDAPGAPVAVEYVTASISSSPIQKSSENVIAGSQTLTDLGLLALVPQFDKVLQETGPHYVFADSLANGIAIADIDGDNEMRVSFVHMGDVQDPNGAGVSKRTTFRTPSGSSEIITDDGSDG